MFPLTLILLPIAYFGRADDVFKSSDYRLSPFELESALIEHDYVAEATVVPSADPIRWHVPKAFITLRPGLQPSGDMAREIFKFIRGREISPSPMALSIRRKNSRALVRCYLGFVVLIFHNFFRQICGIISAQQVARMKLPQFSSRKNSQKPKTQDDEVFAEASQLAMLRLEQCMADLRISVPELAGPIQPRGLHR